MKTSILKGLSDDEANDIVALFRESKRLRAHLTQLLDGKSKSCERATMELSAYDTPNWEYRMADAQGYKRALSEIVQLLSD